jgi:transcriptional regulator with XRE-family HTH domain
MSFRENLKNELIYNGMLVKELSAKSGVNKRTIDKYLRDNGSIPSAIAAVKIARALGISVEYLVTGQDVQTGNPLNSSPDRSLIHAIEDLDNGCREVMLDLAKSLKKMRKKQ